MSAIKKGVWSLCSHGRKDSPVGNTFGYHITEDDGTEDGRLVVWEQITEDDGRRIVASVNKLQGVPTETIEYTTEIWGCVESLATRYNATEKQRDELLIVAKEAHQHLQAIHKSVGAPGDWGYDTKMGQTLFAFYQWERALVAAIAKAEAA